MRRPTDADEFLDLLDQAIFETQDLIASAQEQEKDAQFSACLPVYEPPYTHLRTLHDDVREGRHRFGGADLVFIPFVHKWKSRIPFVDITEVLNGAQQRGF